MIALFIILLDREDYGKIFPTDIGSASSVAFRNAAHDILVHAIARMLALSKTSPFTAIKHARYLQEKVKNISTLLESDYSSEFSDGPKAELENTIVYSFEDDTDLDVFKYEEEPAIMLEILYPIKFLRKTKRTTIACAVVRP